MRPLVFFLLVALAAPLDAQHTGRASFVVYEQGKRVGSLETEVTRSDDGWRVRGSMRTGGSVPVTIANLDLLYDARWSGRFMTLEMKAPDDVIVHVAVTGTTTRTDTVRSTEARFRSNSVSPNTIFLPERAYGAYEAVAARLAASETVSDLPLFVAPIGETRAVVETVTSEPISTRSGSVTARHYVMTEIRDRPTRVDLWADRGRLLRLDVPRQGISVVRSDVR